MNSILEFIGNTPILRLNSSNIYAKLEYFNPFGSIKDRAAYQIISDAEKDGKLHRGMTIVEATSGNMGISLCGISQTKEYRTVIIMPENMSIRRRKLIESYGGELRLTKKELGMSGAIDELENISKSNDVFIPYQFNNFSGVRAHYLTTAPEIDKQMNGRVDVVVCGIGTGATITGIANYFYGRKVKIIGIEPEKSPFLTKGYSGIHNIQGVGAGFCPKILNIDLIDEIISVSDEEAFVYANQLIKTDGLFVGMSSGAALSAAIKISKRAEFKNKNIVTIFADGGDRYL